MTILVNAVAAKMGGIMTGLRALIAELQKGQTKHRFVFLVPSCQAELAGEPLDSIQWRVTSAGERGLLRRLCWDQITLRRWLKREGADVLFSFSDYGMLRCPIPQLLFVRNPIPFSGLFQRHILHLKGWQFRLRYRMRHWLICHSVEAADAVMTPSTTMLEMLRRDVALSDCKATVNYYGGPYYVAKSPPAREYAETIRLLFPTYYADHKNFGIALEALRLLRQRHGSRFRLVTTADPRWELARTTATWKRDLILLDELNRDGAVEVLGLLPHDKLLALYTECHVMCYPTLTESFGHPLVEAMAAGLPVAASNIPVNRELARDAALYFDPLNAAQLAARVEQIVEDAHLRATLQERGRRYAGEFSWTRHTDQLIRRLEELAEGKEQRP